MTQPIVDAEILRACGHAMHKLGGPRLVGLGVTSALPGEGRTLIAAAMALVQARDYGRPTLLMDMAFERSTLAQRFDLPEGPGLAQILAGRASVEDAFHFVGDGLTVMPAGEFTGSPARLATELASSNLLNELREDFEVIIADLPAVLESTYGALLAGVFEQLLLVARARVTPIAAVRKAVAELSTEPIVLLNGTYSRVPGRLRRLYT